MEATREMRPSGKRARRYELVNETEAFRCVVQGCAREMPPRQRLRMDETGVSALTRAAEMFVDTVTEGAWGLTGEFGGEDRARVRVSAAEADKQVMLGDAVKRFLFRELAWEEKLRRFAGTVVNKHTVNMRKAFMFGFDADAEDPAAVLDRWSGYQDTVVRVMPDAAREVLFRTCGAVPGAPREVVEAAEATEAARADAPSFAVTQQQEQQEQLQLQQQEQQEQHLQQLQRMQQQLDMGSGAQHVPLHHYFALQQQQQQQQAQEQHVAAAAMGQAPAPMPSTAYV